MMWSAGILAAISSISYPAISAFVSTHADADQQGLVQVTSANHYHYYLEIILIWLLLANKAFLHQVYIY